MSDRSVWWLGWAGAALWLVIVVCIIWLVRGLVLGEFTLDGFVYDLFAWRLSVPHAVVGFAVALFCAAWLIDQPVKTRFPKWPDRLPST